MAVPPAVATVILPVAPEAGAVTVNEVAVAALTVVDTPLNCTVLSVAVVLKFAPVITTVVPAGPDTGLMADIAGKRGMVTEALFLQPGKTMPASNSKKNKCFIKWCWFVFIVAGIAWCMVFCWWNGRCWPSG